MKIKIANIVIDDHVYPRNTVNEFVLTRMALAHDAGAKFPPLMIEAGSHRLVDGRHRYEIYKRKGVTTVDAEQKTYASEADLFADAVRLNIAHGAALDQYDVRNSIIRLEQYGYRKEQIAEIVRVPVENIVRIEGGFATTQDGQPVALKGGLAHMRGRALTEQQQEINRKYGGGKATFYVRQLRELLEADMWPTESPGFINEMNRLVDAWSKIQKDDDKAA